MPRHPVEDRILAALRAAGRPDCVLPESPHWREDVMRAVRQLGRPAPPPAPTGAWPWATAAACAALAIAWRVMTAVSPDAVLAGLWLEDPAAFAIQDVLLNL